MKLKTGRLILRDIEKDDKDDLYELFTEDFIKTYEAHLRVNSIADVEKYIQFQMDNASSSFRTHYFFMIELQETGEFLGLIGYSFVEDMTLNGKKGHIMEFEYYLLEKHWGKGYMTEALKKTIAVAFKDRSVVKVFAQCHTTNAKSEKVMIKSGMRKSPIQPKPKAYNGIFMENVRYELTADGHTAQSV